MGFAWREGLNNPFHFVFRPQQKIHTQEHRSTMDFDLNEYTEEFNEQWDDVETVHPRDLEADSSWRRIPVGRKITLTVNGVEKYLLELTRMEVEVVADRIFEELYKKRRFQRTLIYRLYHQRICWGYS